MGRSAHSPGAGSLQIIASWWPTTGNSWSESGRSPRHGGRSGASSKKMEPIVTDGYARALELDAECLRIEQRIDDLAEERRRARRCRARSCRSSSGACTRQAGRAESCASCWRHCEKSSQKPP